MKTRFRTSGRASRRWSYVIGLSSTVVWLACAPTPEETVEPAAASAADVEAAFEAFVDAWEAQDLEAAVGTFTTDAVAFDPVPPVKFAGSEGIRTWTSGAFDTLDEISIAVSEVEVRTEGAVAWLTARYTFEGEAEGETTADEGYLSMVWLLQEDGTYKATLFHASNIPEEEPAAEAA